MCVCVCARAKGYRCNFLECRHFLEFSVAFLVAAELESVRADHSNATVLHLAVYAVTGWPCCRYLPNRVCACLPVEFFIDKSICYQEYSNEPKYDLTSLNDFINKV